MRPFSSLLAAPSVPPNLQIPESAATVTVRVIDTNTSILLSPRLFWQPVMEGMAEIRAPIFCFLVSNGDRHVVFDLGVRRDWENYAPKIVDLIKATTEIDAGMDVATALNADTEVGVSANDVEAVIWSHTHFDHSGDPATFPPSTALIVGPGVTAGSWSGYPTHPDGAVLDSDVEGRQVHEISFDYTDQGLRIGRFAAHDYFGDGSFYLLDAPGHAVGHMCGFARTTAGPWPTFVFMGADACHHPGILRPTEWRPLPNAIAPSPLSARMACGTCPGSLLQELIPQDSPTAPFFTVAKSITFSDHPAALDTVTKIHELDADDNIFVIIAHDRSIRDRIPLFPKKVNGWLAEGLKNDTTWLFCEDFESALQGNANGRANGHANGYINGHAK